ncbi:HK97 gp10 family phage protein [Lactococcus lactis]|uniref:HK97-gp10 family putative phage morphogenesis protein n=1 Tax=Lactococcus lactis TaxID=1358 RepID=UPI002418251E|nr:HK97-gp10 family putative phage morphogenesis protein [Lactococcus lactis]MDG4966261.1 HK97 gp10 family phage protein [Lactococcus lactis]
MAKGFTIKGVNELNKKLKENATLSDVKQVVEMNGAELTREAQYEAPIDTSTLERSINMHIQHGGLTAIVEPNMDYEGYVEFGTRFAAAQPYLGPAFKKQSKKFKKDMKRLVE